ncbi:MAG: hypothetical protein EXR12_07210 [Rhodospirillaceae bacterium]|nr:hypothetical protein [Rhodospirillaceae bacterium]
MPIYPDRVDFSDEDVARIVAALPQGANYGREEKLGYILRDWGRNDLPDHLSRATLPSKWAKSSKALTKVEKLAKELRGAIQELDEYSHTRMKLAIASGDPHKLLSIGRDEKVQVQHRFDEGLKFLNAISNLASDAKRGHPRNIAAYLVVLDAAAIYEWSTGRKATRNVDRVTNKETGPFRSFLEAVWPIVFGKGLFGLQAAMRGWEAARTKYDEKSALIANIRLRTGMAD